MSSIEKKYSLIDSNQIWRILISDSEKLIIERRNTDDKEVFFAAYHLENGKPLWEKFQLEEKFWIGIEKIYKDIIFFHKFTKPDMPGHRGILAFDINKKEVLWENTNGSFAFILDDKLYYFREDFEGTKLEPLHFLTGKKAGEIIESATQMEELRNRAYLSEDYSDYSFPEKFYGDEPNAEQIKKAISRITEGKKIAGETEFAFTDGLFLASYHIENNDATMRNVFSVLNVNTSEIIFEDVLNETIDLFASDSFFVYKNFLFLIKEKKQLDVCKITGS
jgi:hypothetical protein